MIRPTLLWTAMLVTLLPGQPHAASFGVHDGRAAREIGESTELYIDASLVASFRLDDRRPEASLAVTVPASRDAGGHEQHRYALCGTITVRGKDGTVEIHEVNGTGILHDPDGHRFEALGAADFTLFYLADPADPAAANSMPQRSSLCHASIS